MIVIKNIDIVNFENIDHLSLTFNPQQMTAIRGENGSGKSTLFHAIAFLLFGYRRGEDFRSYVKLGTDEAHLTMDALLDNDPIHYDVVIRAKGHAGTPVVRKVSYRGTDYGTSDYTKFVKNNNLDHLEEIMFLLQGGVSIIEARPAERAATLKRLFNLDFSDIVTTLKEEQEQNKVNTIELSATLQELQTRTFEKHQLLRETPAVVLDAWTSELSSLDLKLSTMSAPSNEDLSRVTTTVDRLTRAISTEESKLEKLSSDRDRTIATLETSNRRLEEMLRGLTCETFIDGEHRVIEELSKKQEKCSQEKTAIKEQLRDCSNQLAVYQFSLKEILSHISSSSTGVCHACGQPIDSNHLKKLQCERKELEDSVTAQTALTDEMLAQQDKLDKYLSELNSEVSSHKKVISDVQALVTTIDQISSKVASLQTNIETSQQLISAYRVSLQEAVEKQESMQLQLEASLERDELLSKRSTLFEKLESAKALITANSEKRKFNEAIRIKEKERDVRVAELSEKLNNIQLDMTTTKSCIDIFENKLPNYIVLRACRDLESFINSIVRRAFPYMTVELRADRSGVGFFYRTSNSEEAIGISMASGAQKTIITIAYQIALGMLFNTGAIFLDEIDASMDPDNASVIYDFIAGLDNFSQVFFISHREESIQAVRSVNPDVVCYEVSEGVYEELG